MNDVGLSYHLPIADLLGVNSFGRGLIPLPSEEWDLAFHSVMPSEVSLGSLLRNVEGRGICYPVFHNGCSRAEGLVLTTYPFEQMIEIFERVCTQNEADFTSRAQANYLQLLIRDRRLDGAEWSFCLFNSYYGDFGGFTFSGGPGKFGAWSTPLLVDELNELPSLGGILTDHKEILLLGKRHCIAKFQAPGSATDALRGAERVLRCTGWQPASKRVGPTRSGSLEFQKYQYTIEISANNETESRKIILHCHIAERS